MSGKTFVMKLTAAALLSSPLAQAAAAQHTHKPSCEDLQRIRQAADDAYSSMHGGGANSIKVTQTDGNVIVLNHKTSYNRIVKAFEDSVIVKGNSASQDRQTDGSKNLPHIIRNWWHELRRGGHGADLGCSP